MNKDGPMLLIIFVVPSFADSSAKILGQDPDNFEGRLVFVCCGLCRFFLGCARTWKWSKPTKGSSDSKLQ